MDELSTSVGTLGSEGSTTDESTTTNQTAEVEAGDQSLESTVVEQTDESVGQVEGDQSQQTNVADKEDGRTLPKYIRALKETNPEAFKAAKASHFDLSARKSIHPTVQAAREDRELVQSVGGREGLQSLREDGNFFKSAAQQFLKGDPAFVQDLWEEDKIAAALHVMPMLDNYQKHDREGYNSMVTKLWEQEFKAVNIDDAGFRPLQAAIQSGKKDEALTILQSIIDWRKSIGNLANKAEDPRVRTLLTERAQARDNAQKSEHQEFLKTYRTDTLNDMVNSADKIFTDFFKGYKLDPSDKTDLLRDAIRLADQAVSKDTEFIKQRDAHLQSGDSASAKRLTVSRYQREIGPAVQRVARRYGMVSGKSGTKPPANNQQRTPQGTQGNSQMIRVNSVPSREEIDWGKTSREHIFQKKAVRKSDGKWVTWAMPAQAKSA